MARKPFKTLEEQVTILESRGLSMPEYAAYALLGEDYYCVVNGYKEPFLDKEASAEAGHDVYAEGTGFGDLSSLFLFDRDLRNLTFKYLLKAEARVRSVAAYTFSEAYRELDAYLKIANYTDAKDYMVGPSHYDEDLAGLIALLTRKSKGGRACKDFIAHYRQNYDEVPLWVLVKDLTFGNVSYFYGLQKRSVQNLICKRVVMLRRDPAHVMLTPHDMRLALRTLVDFRNICAHDERLWCAKVGPVRDEGFSTMVAKLALILDSETISSFKSELASLVGGYAAESQRLGEVLYNSDLGVPRPEDDK